MDDTTNQVDTSTEAAGDEHEKADKEKDENENNAISLGIQRGNNVLKQYKTKWVFLKNIVFCQCKRRLWLLYWCGIFVNIFR